MNSIAGLIDPYSFGFVALSVFLSVLSAYAALDLAGRVNPAQGRPRLFWLLGASSAIGIGIWSMHFIAMEVLRLPVRVEYDWPTVVLSLSASIVASTIAFYLVSGPELTVLHVFASSLFMGTGISSVYYLGIDALRLPATTLYSPWMVLLSVVLAVGISFASLYVGFLGTGPRPSLGWKKFASAILLGLAIPAMHYVGMDAVSFTQEDFTNPGTANVVSVSSVGVVGIALAAVTILGLVFLTSFIDRRSLLRAQRVADSQSQLQAIFDNLAEGIVVLDRERRIVQLNRTALRLFGLDHRIDSIDSVLDCFELFSLSGEPVKREDRPIARSMRGEFVTSQEFRLLAKATGKAAVCAINSAPITNSAGKTVQVMVRFRDITEQKQIDEARARLAAIVESSEDAIIGKDLHGIVTSWNKGAEKLFGYTSAEMIGRSILRLLPPGHEHEEDEILARIRRGEIVEHFETVRRKKDGQIFNASLTISPIRNADKEIVGASKIARDITDRKQMERQLRQSQKMEAMGQLTGGVAHDFNNLLGIIVGNLDLLERSVKDNESASKRVQTAQKAALRGADLTRRLLAFSSREELNPATVKLEDSIQNMIELAGHAIGPEIIVVTHFDKTVPPVFVDAAGLENALLNLVVNARDAMPKGGSLTISTRMRELETSYPPVVTGEIAAGAYACVTVSDTGHGMSPETLERAFEPFFTTKPRNKGTGLGLAMVYGFVKQSKGTVRLYSEIGYGTTVSLYLPLAKEGSRTTKEPLRAAPIAKRQGKVLVVDDEAALLEIASAFLKDMGYTALPAEDGASALEILSANEDIGLMITDVIMPGGVNGMELAQKVRALSPATKIIFTSGFPADALAERSGTHVDGPLLNKPYQRAEFMAIVRHAMEDPALDPDQFLLIDAESKETGV